MVIKIEDTTKTWAYLKENIPHDNGGNKEQIIY